MSGRVTIETGDALECLRRLPAESLDCCVTSPPYYRLRDYGTATWEGGSPDCDHGAATHTSWASASAGVTGLGAQVSSMRAKYAGPSCDRCGAVRVDLQIGLEETVGEFVERLVEVFEEVRRVLRDDGTCWINIADTYAGTEGGGQGKHGQRASRSYTAAKVGAKRDGKPKELMLVPDRLRIALSDAGWWVRQRIVWAKPNPMPESVRDRCTKSYEDVILLTKGASYWWDPEACREKARTAGRPMKMADGWEDEPGRHGTIHRSGRTRGKARGAVQPAWRNMRDVWSIPPEPCGDAHFATMPTALASMCIALGCRPDGLVLDPFGGSGTTAVAATMLGRRAHLIELNPEYVAIARERLAQGDLFAEVPA